MAGRERDWDESNEGSPDPETLYTKEYCIGSSHACPVYSRGNEREEMVVILARTLG